MHERIEKSGFRAGEYVGYCDGAWRIRQVSNGLWEAKKTDNKDLFRASTLDGIGKGLDQRATRATARILFGS